MKKLAKQVVLLIILLLPVVGLAQPQPPPQPATESSEMILFQNIPSVSGASKYEQELKEAPSYVSIVTAQDIKRFGYRTLADILRSVAGFFTTYDRNYHFIGVRGFARPGDYNTRVLLLVDGHRVNDSIYDQAPIGTDFILDVDLIERVEVIRGPSSSLYGANAFLGVINVITRKGRDLKGTELSGEAGSFGTYKGRASYGNRFQNGVEMIASGTGFTSSGQDLFFKEFDHPRTNHGVAEGCDGDQFYSLFSKLSYRDFSLEGAYVSREKGIPTASFGTVFNNPSTWTDDERLFLDLKYEHSFDNQLSLTARSYFDKYYYHGSWLTDFADPGAPRDLVMARDSGRDMQWGTEVQLQKRLFDKHNVIVGTEYRDIFQQDQWAFDVETVLDDRRDSKVWAVYLQDEYRILDNLIFNGGVRYDNYDTFGGTTNPRLALLYYPAEKTTLKLLYGTAFRPPNAYELYFSDDFSQKSNPDLKPEEIQTYEMVWEQYFGKSVRLTASGFYYKIDNLISQVTDPRDGLIEFENVETIAAKGLEVELERRWANGFSGRLSYSFELTEDENTGETLSNSPQHMVKLNLLAPLISDKLLAGLELQYMSKRKTIRDRNTDDFFLTNLTLFSHNLIKGLELSASVYNLFDVDYGDPGGAEHLQDVIEQDGVSFRIKINYSF